KIKNEVGGVQASISVAVTKAAFEQAYHSVKRGGSVVLVGLPNEEIPVPIFDTVLNGVSVKGSIVGTRKDMQEALQFAADGKVKNEVGGVQASISVAVTKAAFEQAYHSVKRGGSVVLVGLPNEEIPVPIFDTVLNGVSVKGSIVGARKDMQEALQFAADGKVKAIVSTAKLDNINEIFEDMEQGKINGRVVLEF